MLFFGMDPVEMLRVCLLFIHDGSDYVYCFCSVCR